MTLTDYAVGDVITLVRRPVLPEEGKEYREIGIRSFGNGIFHKDPVAGREIIAKKVFSIEPGDLVFSNIFAWEGAVALAADSEKGMIGSHRFMTYCVNQEIADVRYLLPYFYGGPGLDVIRQASPGSAGRNRTLGIKTFGVKRVVLPNLAEQRRVADKLDAAMDRMAFALSLRAKAKKTSLALYDSLLGQVKHWRDLGDGLNLSIEEVAVSGDDNYPMAGVYGFGRGLIDRGTISGSDTKYSKFHRLQKGKLVMSRLKAFEGALTMVPGEFEGRHVSPEFPTFAVDPDVLDPAYLGHLCKWPRFWALLSKESKGVGARRERVAASRLLATSVPFPDLHSQREIAAQLSKAEAADQLGRQQDAVLTSLRPALLDAAFGGRL
ncbi:restriction endonuclease subunit S [Streptomyces akebiae]|uniref:Type I restriction modification DNA specificity domain-containing protein n=1 Tax=Streptomyces akebiae TaxID=2865673 RepID=A0ABX8XX86_9ACTN|nr:hypothetical protein [Streptomyces akebiae]QYX80435.1 hypothetical protein K1J60_31470 [Streptomyces akebiae]